MQLALEQARLAADSNEVPVGAILAIDNKVIAQDHNRTIMNFDPAAHAEVLVLRQAATMQRNHRLLNSTLYVTLEPCAMCAGAIIHSRIGRVVFGAYDRKGGVLSCSMNLFGNDKLNHKVEIVGGVLHFECAKQLSIFFKQRRSGHKQ